MSNLSVLSASEAAVGIATLRYYAGSPNNPSLDQMALEILGGNADARHIRRTISAIADREHDWLKDRATHATVSQRVNDRRERELVSMASVHTAVLSTLQLSSALRTKDTTGISELLEIYVKAMKGIDDFPMGTHAKHALRTQLTSEVSLAAPEAVRDQVNDLLVTAETTYLTRCTEAVYANYDAPKNESSASMDLN